MMILAHALFPESWAIYFYGWLIFSYGGSSTALICSRKKYLPELVYTLGSLVLLPCGMASLTVIMSGFELETLAWWGMFIAPPMTMAVLALYWASRKNG